MVFNVLKSFFVFFLLIGFSISDPFTSLNSSITIKVKDREKITDSLIQKSDSLNGYFLFKNENSVTLKIPTPNFEKFMTFAKNQGHVIQRTHNSNDYSFRITDLNSKIASKESLLKNYFEMIENSDRRSILTVERAVINLQKQIDNLKADLNQVLHKIELANVTINFQFIERNPPLTSGSSDFDWINELNIQDLHLDFKYDDE